MHFYLITVCKALSTPPPYSVNSSAFLHSIIEHCVAETGRPKTEQTKMETLQLAMKIITNCCCCVEGRLLITKVCYSQHNNNCCLNNSTVYFNNIYIKQCNYLKSFLKRTTIVFDQLIS